MQGGRKHIRELREPLVSGVLPVMLIALWGTSTVAIERPDNLRTAQRPAQSTQANGRGVEPATQASGSPDAGAVRACYTGANLATTSERVPPPPDYVVRWMAVDDVWRAIESRDRARIAEAFGRIPVRREGLWSTDFLSPLHPCSPTHAAVQSGDVEILRQVVVAMDGVNAICLDTTQFRFAASCGQLFARESRRTRRDEALGLLALDQPALITPLLAMFPDDVARERFADATITAFREPIVSGLRRLYRVSPHIEQFETELTRIRSERAQRDTSAQAERVAGARATCAKAALPQPARERLAFPARPDTTALREDAWAWNAAMREAVNRNDEASIACMVALKNAYGDFCQ